MNPIIKIAPLLLLAAALSHPLSAQTTPQGRFASALAPKSVFAEAAYNPVYSVLPLTVECFAKLNDKSQFNILLANEPKSSTTHWELYTFAAEGDLSAYLPGYKPETIRSHKNITDGKWHYLAMILEPTRCRLFIDGQSVADQKIEKVHGYTDVGGLKAGFIDGVPGAGDLFIDEVRISRSVRDCSKTPAEPFTNDKETIGLWHFDTEGKSPFEDYSNTHNLMVVKSKAGREVPKTTEGKTKWADMDYGPFFTSTLVANYPQKNNITPKGISIRVGKNREAAVCFDPELLRVSVAWTGPFIKMNPTREGLAMPMEPAGTPVWGTLPGPGWANKDGKFDDPRPDKLGPLPKEWGKYKGLYINKDRVVVSYTTGGVDVLESYDVLENAGKPVFLRHFEIGPTKTNQKALLMQIPDGIIVQGSFDGTAVVHGKVDKNRIQNTSMALVCREGHIDPEHIRLNVIDKHKLVLDVPASQKTRHCTMLFYHTDNDPADANLLGRIPEQSIAPSLSNLIHGGPPSYPTPVITKGVLGSEKGPYVSDLLTAPDDNPWKSFLRFGGHDFFKNGDMAICSISGDVWILSNITPNLERLVWRRFATGLHQPLGLKVVDEKVYIIGRDQITRLHDLNADGEADFYENFNNDAKVTTNGHAYVANLETDPQGNFYYTKCGDGTEHGGTVLKVSKDGSKLSVFATGVRNPNGLGVSPTGMVTEADNQGEWVPASRLDVVKEGSFLGYTPMSKTKIPPTDPGRPLCWMPQNVDNSSSSQTWVTSDRWGPFSGHMLHTSYGAASLLLVLDEEINGQRQGGVVKFPLSFATGIMRARFSPADGQLYLSGLKGWQTGGSRDGALHRVRFTNKPVHLPTALHIHKNGITLTFPTSLDKETAQDLDSYSILQWNYRWTSGYGSKHYSVENPEKQGYDTVEIKSAKLLPDGKTVFLEIPTIRPVMQMQILYRLDAADGAEIKGDIHNTIHELGPVFKP